MKFLWVPQLFDGQADLSAVEIVGAPINAAPGAQFGGFKKL